MGNLNVYMEKHTGQGEQVPECRNQLYLAVIYWVPAMVEHHLCPTHSSSPLYSSEYEKCPKYYEALGDSEGARGGIVPVKG